VKRGRLADRKSLRAAAAKILELVSAAAQAPAGSGGAAFSGANVSLVPELGLDGLIQCGRHGVPPPLLFVRRCRRIPLRGSRNRSTLDTLRVRRGLPCPPTACRSELSGIGRWSYFLGAVKPSSKAAPADLACRSASLAETPRKLSR